MPDDGLLTWCDELHQVRGNVSQLQATLNQILAKAPSVTQYQELYRMYGETNLETTANSSQISEKMKTSLNSPQLKVAVRLKSLFDRGLLPFLLGMSRINFKSPKCDRFVGYLLDYCPPEQEVANITPPDKSPTKTYSAGNPDSSEVNLYPPNLPPIENKGLLNLVFTDKSLRQAVEYLELSDISRSADTTLSFNSSHNRKLCLKGKYTLDLALVDILDEALPHADENDLEYVRYRLTSAPILAKFAYVYNFPEALVHQISKDASILEKLAIFKTTFLAYIGGLTRDNYLPKQILNWLKALFKPLISVLETELLLTGQIKSKESVAWAEFQFIMSRLNNYFLDSIKKMHFDFVIIEEDPFVCQLKVNDEGVFLGIGSGSTAAAANRQAVYKTMTDPELSERLFSYISEQMRLFKQEKKAAQHTKSDQSSENLIYHPLMNMDRKPPPPPSGPSRDQAGASAEAKTASNPPAASKKPLPQINLAKAPLAPLNQPRMPLQYGMIPSSMPKGPKRK